MAITIAHDTQPTVVLVHGAFAESSSWNNLIALLSDADYPVIAAANPLRGVAHDAAYVRSLLDRITGDIVLVGHSYGGSVISNAALGNPNVKALIFVGAFAPESGENAVQLSEGGTLGDTLESIPLPDGNIDLYIRQEQYHQQFAADSSASNAATLAATQRPIVEAALGEESGDPAWKQIPSWFLFGSDDKNIPATKHRFMAERAGSRETVEIPGGSHTVAIPEAPQLMALIERAVADVKGNPG
ncbi:alpha/beta fold hydrolase [Streptomyces graminifolii]|uniref:alpha/beta fold hydrolase n=1 Tax=Streptomyces graminifolii TaxID=1266771 RepID=UPI0040583FB5